MAVIRHPAVAGQFYPGDAGTLSAQVADFLAQAPEPEGAPPKAVIAPHAGYVYSGPVAATAYRTLEPLRGTVTRVVLLGPCHRVPVLGLAATTADFYETPLGNIPLDKAATADILDMAQVEAADAPHAPEHSLEVHLPFLQMVLGEFALLPLVVGQATPEQVADVLERLWGGPETLIVISTDLSHFLDYDTARKVDARTVKTIESLNPHGFGRDDACGRIPVSGLLEVARRKGMSITTLDVRNSGDTAGDKSRVVGYGSWILRDGGDLDEDAFGGETKALLARHGETLIRIAAASIEHGLETGKPGLQGEFHSALAKPGACFVTLKKKGQLRGCIGSLQAHRPLLEDVATNGYSAAFRDHRFGPLKADELADLDLSISVLSDSVPIEFADEADLLAQLRPGIDGLIIQDGGKRALFLPSVWEQLPDKARFMGHLKAKAGMKPDHWSPGFKAWRFVTEEIKASETLDDPASLWTKGG